MHLVTSLSDEGTIDSARERGVCPHCESRVEPGTGVGSGRRADGLFCSLKCFAEFYDDYITRQSDQARQPRNN